MTAEIIQCNDEKKITIKDRVGFFSKDTQELLRNHPIKDEVVNEFFEALSSARSSIEKL